MTFVIDFILGFLISWWWLIIFYTTIAYSMHAPHENDPLIREASPHKYDWDSFFLVTAIWLVPLVLNELAYQLGAPSLISMGLLMLNICIFVFMFVGFLLEFYKS